MRDLAGYRAGGCHSRIGQIDERSGVTHSPRKVAVGCAQTDLALAEDALMATQAGAAGSSGPRSACLQENADQPLPFGLLCHLVRGRRHDQTHAWNDTATT